MVLLLAAGRDCTDLFDSYHPFTDKPREVLDKFYVGEVKTTEFPQYKPDTGFYKELRQRVGQYFTTNKVDSKGMAQGMWRLAFMLTVAMISWYIAYSNAITTSLWIKLPVAVIFGAFQALPLLHTMVRAQSGCVCVCVSVRVAWNEMEWNM